MPFINGWIVFFGDKTQPLAFFKDKNKADDYAATVPGYSVTEARATYPIQYIDYVTANF